MGAFENQFDALALSNANSVWGAVAAEVLVRSGVRVAVISPGSRSTPLAFAFSRHPGLACESILDERSAAFFALGQSRSSGLPVALVCTSGTAAANYYPAVIEARESGVPLLVMTADRPPEMRHCHAGQTIDQLKIYGNYPVFQAEMAVPNLHPSRLRHLRQTLVDAVRRSLYPYLGPIHLNMPFRDPLAPVPANAPGDSVGTDFREHLELLVDGIRPPVASTPGIEKSDALCVARELKNVRRGLIVAGPARHSDGRSFSTAVGRISQSLGWPVLADGLSPVRNHASVNPNLVTRYSAILRDPAVAEKLRPDAVLALGPYPASKTLRGWLEPLDLPAWFIHPGPDNPDALHSNTTVLNTSVEAFAAHIAFRRRKPGSFCSCWMRAERDAGTSIDRAMRRTHKSFEGRVAAVLSRCLPKGISVFVANSMPVRDVEFFWRPNDRAARIFCNRGANGIDGTLSTALGIASDAAEAVLVTGDLALLHDLGGFLAAKSVANEKMRLTIVLLNNNGGGIFESLPIARLGGANDSFENPIDLYEKFFATPQNFDFAKLANAHGVEYHLLPDASFVRHYFTKKAAKKFKSGLRLLELRCDRKRDQKERRIVLDSAGK